MIGLIPDAVLEAIAPHENEEILLSTKERKKGLKRQELTT
jgi:hypothetical protein